MRVLFITDAKIYKIEGNYYINNGVKASVKRFSQKFGTVTLLGLDRTDACPPNNIALVEKVKISFYKSNFDFIFNYLHGWASIFINFVKNIIFLIYVR